MSREIEFRVWLKQQKQMRYDIQLSKYFNEFIGFSNDYELMQYTGLKDKNGTKIFEGDVVKFKDKLYKVEFYQFTCKFALVLITGNGDAVLNRPRANFDLEVVGNIYENKELL